MTRRLTALVIGNADYTDAGKLKNPGNDATDISAKLNECGFTVTTRLNCSHREMDQALKDFKKALKDSDVGLFFFAGHGMQVDGSNYLAAVDTDVNGEVEAKHSSLALNQVIEVMEKADNASSIIILDACRNNPFERSWARSMSSRGLAPVYAPRGTMVAYATSPGQIASDGRGRNGAYTAALLEHLATPDCSIEGMFKRVRNTLSTATDGKQISWEHTSLAGDFFFNLSLGARIDEYADTSLRDSLFVIDEKKASHRVIKALKSHNWYQQNPAVEEFTASVAGRALSNSLFVVGRNIYQAACGGSKTAYTYITDFMSSTAGLKSELRKAILDGMLFEVFFDPNARLRKEFKTRKFQELFHLQQHTGLKSSFDFIAECLLPDIGRFYTVPGKIHAVVVDVVTKPGTIAASHVLKSVHCGGESILWMEDADYDPEPGELPMLEKLNLAKFEERIAEQMLVPEALLTVKYASFPKTGKEKNLLPVWMDDAKEIGTPQFRHPSKHSPHSPPNSSTPPPQRSPHVHHLLHPLRNRPVPKIPVHHLRRELGTHHPPPGRAFAGLLCAARGQQLRGLGEEWERGAQLPPAGSRQLPAGAYGHYCSGMTSAPTHPTYEPRLASVAAVIADATRTSARWR